MNQVAQKALNAFGHTQVFRPGIDRHGSGAQDLIPFSTRPACLCARPLLLRERSPPPPPIRKVSRLLASSPFRRETSRTSWVRFKITAADSEFSRFAAAINLTCLLMLSQPRLISLNPP